ncbi:MAG: glycosyltransferase family 4 protein [Alphaproteobacteria bacterium]
MSAPTLLYLVTEDWFFWSHRLPIARAARDAGFRVVVATRENAHGDRIRAEGFALAPIRLRRRAWSPPGEIAAIEDLVRLYRQERPSIVHHVAMKPVIYGTIAARRTGVPAIINALDGLGFVYGSSRPAARLIRPGVSRLLAWALGRPNVHVHLQNEDDRATLVRVGALGHDRVSVIRGAGIDLGHFSPLPDPPPPFTIAIAARMIAEKGIDDLVDAVGALNAAGTPARLVLAGAPDRDSPTAIPEAMLAAWSALPYVEWRGHVGDVRTIWADAHVSALPSSGEGLPKALIEAAACERALVATDVPGNREVVRDGETGLVVPYRDVAALAGALARLSADPALRRRMALAARAMVEREFSEAVVAAATLRLYRSLLPATDASLS